MAMCTAEKRELLTIALRTARPILHRRGGDGRFYFEMGEKLGSLGYTAKQIMWALDYLFENDYLEE
jgi:hypothetical protein